MTFFKVIALCISTRRMSLKVAIGMQLEQQGLEAGEGTIDDPEVLASVMGAREAIEDTEDDQVLREYSQTFDEQSKSCIQASVSCSSGITPPADQCSQHMKVHCVLSALTF